MISGVLVRVIQAVGIGAGLLVSAACGGGEGIGSLVAEKTATVTISPADGANSARPDQPVTVKATDGTLQDVQVAAGGKKIAGTFDAVKKVWTATANLAPGTSYTVTATAANKEGKETAAKSAFSTLKGRTFRISDITPGVKGETVGVGMPIIVTLSRPITDAAGKAAVSKALNVTAQKPVEGAWRWLSPTQLVYRTKTYWPAHQNVTLDARLSGVQGGKDLWGAADKTHTFKIGASIITKINQNTTRMSVFKDGKLLRSFPVTVGSGDTREYTTTSGTHLTMSKERTVTMTSPGRKPGDPGYYKVDRPYAVRISNSGEYVHGTEGGVGGKASHGCVRLSMSDAVWFYNLTQRGDVVKLTGTERRLEPGNGWGYWQIPFAQWTN